VGEGPGMRGQTQAHDGSNSYSETGKLHADCL